MGGKMRLTALAAAFLAASATAVAVGRPTIAERWAIYASAIGGPPASYPMFLGPFPTKFSCEVEARIIVQNGGHAECRGHWEFETISKEQDLLWAQFWPSARWIAFCQARVGRRATGSRSGQSRVQTIPTAVSG